MKKVAAVFVIVLVGVIFSLGSKYVFAVDSSPSGVNIVPIMRERMGDIKEQMQGRKEDRIGKVRQMMGVRVGVLNRIINNAGSLLDKLQVRIDKAKQAGKDMASAESLMSDARGKLADAKTKLAGVQNKEGVAADRTAFRDMHGQLLAIMQDLHAVRRDAAQIISILKGFNSATSSGHNPQKEGTSPVSAGDKFP